MAAIQIDHDLIKWHRQIDRLTVQFHRYSEVHEHQRAEIREGLAKTHECVWEYRFLWEEWARKAAD